MDFRRFIAYLPISPVSILQTLAVGLVVGFLMYVGFLGLQQFAFDPVLCRDNGQYCANSSILSVVTSVIIFQFVGLVALVRIGVIRPLLVVLATIVTVYGFHVWLGGLSWWVGALYLSLLVGFSYIYYTWINRMSVFPVALGLTLLSVIVARLLLSYW